MLVVSSSNANMGSTNHKLSDWFWMSKVEMHRSSKCWIITRRGLKWTEINLHHPDCAGPAGGGALLVAEACSGGLGFLLSWSVSPWYMVLMLSGSKLLLDINILQCKESPDIAAGTINCLKNSVHLSTAGPRLTILQDLRAARWHSSFIWFLLSLWDVD